MKEEEFNKKMKESLKELNIDDKQFSEKSVQAEISNAKNIAETSSFSTKIMPLANSNLERFTGIENTE